MSKEVSSWDNIEQFLMGITETAEYNAVEYLVFSIRKNYLHYLSGSRIKQFKIPPYLEPLVETVIDRLNDSGIRADEMLQYMLDNDINNWIHYYAYTFIIPASKKEMADYVKSLDELFALVLTAYILDTFRENRIDIRIIVDNEVLEHETNQYGLSIVNGVEFKRDYFVFEDKAYMYSILTNTNVIEFTDSMPGFAKIITEKIESGDILLRLDERLALPLDQAITYSTLNFEKFYGPQFHFKDTMLSKAKTIIVHIDNESCDKLLMVVKQDYDSISYKKFLHIEIETLPYRDNESTSNYCITTFLHGMYYPEDDYFTHIDCTKNQYQLSDYLKKYSEETEEISVDFYTEKDLHYKIWCVENGEYSKQVWYELMMVSLPKRYQTLLDEILK